MSASSSAAPGSLDTQQQQQHVRVTVKTLHPSSHAVTRPSRSDATKPTTTTMPTTAHIAMKRSKLSLSPRRAARARGKLLLVYIGIGAYMIGLMLWWATARSDALSLAPRKWLAVHDKRLDQALRVRTASVRASSNKSNSTTTAATTARTLTCIGWRQTGGCDPNGPREPANDVACDVAVAGGSSGYCLLCDDRTGDDVRAMQLTCDSLRRDMTLKCADAVAFVAFTNQVKQLVSNSAHTQLLTTSTHQPLRQSDLLVQTATSNRNSNARGIVMVVYPKLLPSVYASIRSLRSLNCTLAIELWYLATEMQDAHDEHSNAILQTLQRSYGPVTLHAIDDTQVAGFNAKVYAIAHTTLDSVLFLDADNVAVRDPAFLFDTPEFLTTGALFWPDFWHPSNTIFNIQGQSLLWELLNMAPVDTFEQESGQLVIDRTRHAAALELLQLFAFHTPSLFDTLKLVHGDKDLFRLAWLKTNSTFHMIQRPPAAAGRMDAAGVFCGMTMAQYDPAERDVLFLHRNAKKLTGGTAADEMDPQVLVWTHLQTFDWDVDASRAAQYAVAKAHYTIDIFSGGKEFPETHMCYGERREREADALSHFHVTPWEALPDALRDMEPTLLVFAHDAMALEAIAPSTRAHALNFPI